MALPLPLIISLVSNLMSGPINKLLDAHIKDAELRKKLQAELELKLTDHMGKSLELEQANSVQNTVLMLQCRLLGLQCTKVGMYKSTSCRDHLNQYMWSMMLYMKGSKR